MSELKLNGKIKSINPTETFDSGSQKVTFIVANNEGYNGEEQIFAFELFAGASKTEKIDNFLKYNQVGSSVEVSFNIKCREYKGKYYTNLEAWKVWGVGGSNSAPAANPNECIDGAPQGDGVLDEEPPF